MIRHILLVSGFAPRLFANSYCFCAAGKDGTNLNGSSPTLLAGLKSLSESAQMALWASSTIKTILDAPDHQNIDSKPLWQTLVELQLDPTIQHLLTPSVESEFKKMFVGGISIDQPLLSQQRIKQGSVGEEFTFFPNLLTTRQVFTALSRGSDHLITGDFGCGKTTSMVLYCLLSNLINKFRFQSWSQSQPLREVFQRQAEALKRMINTNVSRYWYWKFDPQCQTNLKKLMLKQSYELSQQTKAKLLGIQPYSEFVKQLRSLYPPQFYHCHIIDEANLCFSVLRNLNSEGSRNLKHIKELELKLIKYPIFYRRCKMAHKQHSQLVKDMKLLKLKILDFRAYTRQLDQFILGSSMNVQRDLIQKGENPSFQSPKVGLGIKHKHYSMSFKDNLRQPWGNVDFMHYFFHQIRKNIQKDLTPAEINLIYQSFKKVYQQKGFKAKSYYRFVFISYYFSQLQSAKEYLEQLKKKPDEARVKQIFRDILQDFPWKCIYLLREKISLFKRNGYYDETRISKQVLIDILYFTALQLKKSNLTTMEFEQDFLRQLMPQEVSLEEMFFSSKHNSSIFPVYIDEYRGRTINFQWDPQDCIDILEGPASGDFLYFLKGYIEQPKKSPVSEYFKQRTRQALQKGTVAKFIFFYLNPLTDGKFDKTIQKFEIFSMNTFTPFLTAQKSISLNFRSLISFAKDTPSQLILATPITPYSRQSEHQPKIDFVMGTYNKQAQQYTFYTFDFTIAKKALDQRISYVEKLFKEVIKSSSDQKLKLKYKIIHVIVAFESVLQPGLLWKKKVTSHQDRSFQIVLSSIQGMNLQSNVEGKSQVMLLWKFWHKAAVNYDWAYQSLVQRAKSPRKSW